MAEAALKYDSPEALALMSAAEQRNGLPSGLLTALLTRGERSNSDQVSEDGARGLGQIIPATQKAAITQFGVDPYLSNENSVDVAAKLLKQNLDANKGDVPRAVATYHGGTDEANWGPRTRAYVKRVTGALPATPDASAAPAAADPAAAPGVAPAGGPSTFDQMWAAANAPAAKQVANILAAYQGGKMAPDEAKQFESDVQAGKIMLPAGQTLQGAAPAPAAGAVALPAGVVDAYRMGQITGKDRDQLLADVKSGKVVAPAGSQLQLEAQYPNRDYTHIMPGQNGVQKDEQGRPFIDTTPNAPTTIGDKILGAGEAGLSAATGLVAYPAAVATGAANLAGAAINKLQGGPPIDANSIETNANAMGDALTYHPRTDVGQQYAQNLGDAMQPLAGLAPAEAGALHSGVAPVVGAVRQVARAAPGAAIEAAQNLGAAARTATTTVGDAVGGLIDRARGAAPAVAEEPAPTPGTGGSVGAAGTDMATQRQQAAAALPVPINLTKGQASRTFEQLRFEEETAKDANLGKDLRENSANQNAAIPQNFDRMIDQTGAEAVAPADVGRAVVDNGLVKDAARAKAEYNAKYKLADKAGEMSQPLPLQPLADYLNQNRAGRNSAPILATIADEMKVRGVGDGSIADGTLSAGDATLSQIEAIRKAVNKFVKADPNDMRVGAEIKNVIDNVTEGAGGELYAQARKARQRYAQLYEDNAVVSDLLNSRKGTSDRKVALENVFDRTVLNGSREDLGKLRRTLQVSGSEGGAQAWRELQGATLRYLNEESTKGVGTDIHGNPIVSAARLNNAVRSLDAGGKLDFLLGKRGAAQVRDLNEIVKVIKTSPPGSVNFSNTASVLLGALSDFKTVGGGAAESALMGALTGLPIPILTGIRTGLRVVKQNAANRETLRRVDEALGRASAQAKKPKAAAKASTVQHPPAKTIH